MTENRVKEQSVSAPDGGFASLMERTPVAAVTESIAAIAADAVAFNYRAASEIAQELTIAGAVLPTQIVRVNAMVAGYRDRKVPSGIRHGESLAGRGGAARGVGRSSDVAQYA